MQEFRAVEEGKHDIAVAETEPQSSTETPSDGLPSKAAAEKTEDQDLSATPTIYRTADHILMLHPALRAAA